MIAMTSSSHKKKLKFQAIRDLILREDSRKRKPGESSGATLNIEGKGRSNQGERNQYHGRLKSKERSKSRPHGETIGGNCKKMAI